MPLTIVITNEYDDDDDDDDYDDDYDDGNGDDDDLLAFLSCAGFNMIFVSPFNQPENIRRTKNEF